MYYKPGYKKFMNEDPEKQNTPNLLQDLGVGMGLKSMRFDNKRGTQNLKGKKKSKETLYPWKMCSISKNSVLFP